MRLAHFWLTLFTVVLIGCGSTAPLTPTRSPVEVRQTQIALQGLPTVPPAPTELARSTATPRPAINLVELLNLTDDDPRALGDPKAPVLMIEFTDYECPFCARFVNETRPRIISEFVETGVVRLVVRDFPLSSIHGSAVLAASVTHCAAAQDRFWPVYEMLFQTHGVEWGGVPKRDRATLIELAGNLAVDTEQLIACLDNPATEAAVLAEVEAATRLGINSTPNFLVNGQLVRGALPFESFASLIRQLAGR
ncbi:DsbA family protein [uncultured Chloroflexus sp.]|uniref:DsbA family protein n=1 Tax=uncultured Chloroflexus sp. TaxID=214040 RepID=UPI002623A18A|nr:DsbA family protein [uncultured Chloroflexus sp.]